MRILCKVLLTSAVCLFPSSGYSQQTYWIHCAEFASGSINALAANKRGDVFAGTDLGGVYRTTNTGLTWTQINAGITNLHVRALAADSDNAVFVGTQGGGVFRSTNNGEQWSSTGVPTMWTVRTLAAHAGGIVLAGTSGGGVFRSTDHGLNWSPVNTGLADPYIRSFAFGAGAMVYAGTGFAGVFRSNNAGESWNLTGMQSDNDFRCLVVGPGRFVFAGGWGTGVFRSSNEGTEWVSCNNGLTNLVTESLAISRDSTLIVATREGVFTSLDWGGNWFAASDGLTDLDVRSVVVDQGGFVYAGTAAGGVFRSSRSLTSVSSSNPVSPSGIQLNQNYPNPFNPSTTIEFTVGRAGNVRVKVYNILGQEVATLMNEDIPAGHYRATFDRANLCAGVYVCTIASGRYSASKKMILMK